jgi:hypothetical protein
LDILAKVKNGGSYIPLDETDGRTQSVMIDLLKKREYLYI